MTREEEIKEGSIDYMGPVNELNPLLWISFREGAKWADSHPRKGLVDIEKACTWLKEMMQGHLVLEVLNGEHYEADLIKDFRKAMEE